MASINFFSGCLVANEKLVTRTLAKCGQVILVSFIGNIQQSKRLLGEKITTTNILQFQKFHKTKYKRKAEQHGTPKRQR